MIELQAITQQTLHDALQAGVTIITGNNRLAKNICREFDNSLIKQTQQVWISPDCLPFNNWLLRQWEMVLLANLLPKNSMLLSKEQELIVWESIIRKSSYAEGLLRISATAKSVRDAWHVLQQWNLLRTDADYQLNEDVVAFHSWANEFENYCHKKNWYLHDQLPSLFEKLISQYSLELEPELWITGFDSLTPQQQSLFENIILSGGKLKWVQQNSLSESVVCVSCSSSRHEFETVACWARQNLEHNPENRIGIVVPNLVSVRDIVVQSFDKVLHPSSFVTGSSVVNRLWNISLGLPLANYTIITMAFQLLEFNKSRIDIEIVSSVLRSPYLIGVETEIYARCLLDRQLRELGESLVSLKTLHYFASQCDKAYFCPILSERLIQLINLNQNCPNLASCEQWTSWIITWLKATGWREGRTLSSEEFQTLEAWSELLHQFSAFEFVTEHLNFQQAVTILHRIAIERIYQCQSNEAPIQILGVFETIGSKYDLLWVTGLHDNVWPSSTNATSFIPMHIQKQFNLPHAHRQLELLKAKDITTRLVNSALQVVLSFPEKDANQILRKSPLIEHYPMTTIESLGLDSLKSWNEKIWQQRELDKLIDDVAPPLLAQEKQLCSGGSNIFKNQSLCPFRAFAESRLNAKPIRSTQTGLDALKRGSLLHTVLELFWTTVEDQKKLLALDPHQLEDIINTCINHAVADMAKLNPQTFNIRFTDLEKQRLKRILYEWLELEKIRLDFSVIEVEKKLEVDINGVKIKLVIDRIDQLKNGRNIIIDYKSGKVSPSDWFGERPADPQLPLYSVVSSKSIAAVLFAQLKSGELKFNGIVDQIDTIPGLPPKNKCDLKNATETWPQVVDEWKNIIYKLAEDFKNGHAEVDPRDKRNTCKNLYCELSTLCRIND